MRRSQSVFTEISCLKLFDQNNLLDFFFW